MRKLNEDEYFQLDEQFNRTPAANESFGASGEHMQLRYLLRKMGFSVPNRKFAEIDLADKLLCQGWAQ